MKTFLTFLLCLLIAPSITLAQTADVDPQGTSSCVSLTNNLRYRSTDAQTGGDVSVLQDFLQSSGYLKASPSGYMGLLTVKGVKGFQSDNGISPTGYVGPLTRAKIQTASCAGTTANISNNSTSNNQNGTTLVSGCASGAMFSSTTGASCSSTSSGNSANTTVTKGTVSSDNRVSISSVNPQVAQVGQSLTVYFTNGGDAGSIVFKTTDGAKSWHIPYTRGTVYNGFIYYDGSKVTFTVPSTIGAGQLPENTGYEAPIAITSGTYNLYVYRATPNSISTALPIIISTVNTNATSTQASITITSPMGGGNYISINDPLNISWNSVGGSTVAVYLMFSDGGACYLGSPSSEGGGPGHFSFTPASYQCPNMNKVITAGGEYKIGLFLHNGDNSERGIAQSYSGNFILGTVSNQQKAPVISSVGGVFVPGTATTVTGSGFSHITANSINSITTKDSYGSDFGFSFNWTPIDDNNISITLPTNGMLVPAGQYTLFLSNANGISNPFIITITSRPTTTATCSPTMGTYRSPTNGTSTDGNPLVSFISPNGGETLCVGKTYHITWDSTNVDKVSLGYSFGEGSLNWFQGNSGNNIANTGSYDWNVNIGNTTNTNLKLYIIGYHTGVGSKAAYSNNFTVSQ